jgi:hypothetical protein
LPTIRILGAGPRDQSFSTIEEARSLETTKDKRSSETSKGKDLKSRSLETSRSLEREMERQTRPSNA